MKSKLGILSALILSLAIAGSTFAASGTTNVKKNSPAAKTAASKTAKVRKPRKHHKTRKARSAKKMKSATTTTPQK